MNSVLRVFYPVDPVCFDSCQSNMSELGMFLGQYDLRIYTPPDNLPSFW